MEKETDIDALARMVADGFASIEKRFDSLESDVKELKTTVAETNRLIDTSILPTFDEHRIKALEELAA